MSGSCVGVTADRGLSGGDTVYAQEMLHDLK